MRADDLVPVYSATDEVQALLYRTMLEEAGIDVIELPYEEAWLGSVKTDGLHSQLMVRAEDAEDARALVQAFTAEAAAGELNPQEPPVELSDRDDYGTPES